MLLGNNVNVCHCVLQEAADLEVESNLSGELLLMREVTMGR